MKPLLLATLLLLTAPVLAQSEELMLPIERTNAGWLVTVYMCIEKSPDGGGQCYPVRLLLDAGATETALDAKYLSLQRSDEARTTFIGTGSEQRAVLTPVILLLTRPNGRPAQWGARITPLEVDFSALRRGCDCTLAGLIGINMLEKFESVTFDFKAKKLTLRRSKTELASN